MTEEKRQEGSDVIEQHAKNLIKRLAEERVWDIQNMSTIVIVHFKNMLTEYEKEQVALCENLRKENSAPGAERLKFYIREMGKAKTENGKLNVLRTALSDHEKIKNKYEALKRFVCEKYGEGVLSLFYKQSDRKEKKRTYS